MKDEKILKSEQLSDGELDKVAGGTFMFGKPVVGPGLMNSDGTPYKVRSNQRDLLEEKACSTGH